MNFHNSKLYIAGNSCLLTSKDTGNTWEIDTTNSKNSFKSIGFNNNYTYGGTSNGFIWQNQISTSISEGWEPQSNPLIWNNLTNQLIIPESIKAELQIIDIQGKVRERFQIDKSDLKFISFEGYNNGVYFARLITNENQYLLRFLILN